MELQPYLGKKMMSTLVKNVEKEIDIFRQQSAATKLALATETKYALEVYREGSKVLVDILEYAGKKMETLETKVNALEDQYGKPDDEYIRKHTPVKVNDSGKPYAKRLAINYINQYCQNDYDSDTK